MDEPNIKTAEAIYYVCVWIVGALAGLSRSLRDDSINTCRNFVGIGCCSGFLGFAVVGVYDWTRGGGGFSLWGGIATSALIGLAGKEQDNLIRLVWKSTIERFFGETRGPKDDGERGLICKPTLDEK